jgi:acetyl esterase/lipase
MEPQSPERTYDETHSTPKTKQNHSNLSSVALMMAHLAEEVSTTTRKKLNAITNTNKTLEQCLNKLDDIFSTLLPLLNKMAVQTDWNYDSRGGWEIFFFLLQGRLHGIEEGLKKISAASNKETMDAKIFRMLWSTPRALSEIKQYMEELETLTRVLPVLILVSSGEGLTEHEVDKLAESLFIYPFWYRFDPGMKRIKEVMNFIKITVGKTYTKQGLSKHLSWAQNGLNTLFNKSTKLSHELCSKEASIELLKQLWNIPEDGLIGTFLTIVNKQAIKVSERIFVPCDDKKRTIPCTVISAKSLPIAIPPILRYGLSMTQSVSQQEQRHISRVRSSNSLLKQNPTSQVSTEFTVSPEELNEFHEYMKSIDNTALTDVECYELDKLSFKEQLPVTSPQSSNTANLTPLDNNNNNNNNNNNANTMDDNGDVRQMNGSEDSSTKTLSGANVTSLWRRDSEPNIHELMSGVQSQSSSLKEKRLPENVVSDVAKSSLRESKNLPQARAPIAVPIILHFRGSGFIAGSVKTHEMYLREWARATKAIVFSVEYTLAPEAKYPQALEECYQVYKWLIDPNNEWGIFPMPLIVAGDSSGGTLALAVTYKAIQEERRLPDALFLAYPATDLTKTPTPSRVLFLNDVLLPYYFLEVCLEAYISPHDDPHHDPLLSPLAAKDELLAKLPNRLIIMSAGFDPLLDDTTRFLYRLDKIKKSYEYYLFKRLPHGFLNFGQFVNEPDHAVKKSCELLAKVVNEISTLKM